MNSRIPLHVSPTRVHRELTGRSPWFVELSFAPTLEKQFNFNVELGVKNKSRPLVLNVKGEGYAIHDALLLEDASGQRGTLDIGHF